jgi:hypothetical protein
LECLQFAEQWGRTLEAKLFIRDKPINLTYSVAQLAAGSGDVSLDDKVLSVIQFADQTVFLSTSQWQLLHEQLCSFDCWTRVETHSCDAARRLDRYF